MKNPLEQIMPNSIYQVFKALPLTSEGQKSLTYLYQPIIGANAMSLYYHLLGDASDLAEQEFTHLDCLNTLNIGMPDFFAARRRLEGMGLMTVFQKEDPEFGKMFLYQLEEPVNPQRFILDTTYSFLLHQAVGERRFQQIIRRFKPKIIDLSSYVNTTANFTQVYGQLDLSRFAQEAPQLEFASQSFDAGQTSTLEVADDVLDWDFLSQLAQKKFIAKENFTPEFRMQLSIYASLYGYKEMELVELLTQVVALDTGLVNSNDLRRLIEKNNAPKALKNQTDLPNVKQSKQRYQQLSQKGFTQRDLNLIKTSEETAPSDFLKAIKQEKNSFVSDSEMRLLKTLVERTPLTNAVINILIHYVLVVQNNSTLQERFVTTIAANWSEKGFKTPEMAIEYVRQYVRESKEKQKENEEKKQARQNRPYQKKAVRKEVLPEWVIEPKVTQEDPEKQAEIQRRLQEYLKRKEGEQ